MDEFEWLAMAGWLSIPEWAGFQYADPSTVSRKVPEWTKGSLIVNRRGGHLVRPRDRFLNGIGGLAQMFPKRHIHPGPDDDHEHHPLHPDWEDHAHPGHFSGFRGALDLWERLWLLETWYPVAPTVLQGEGAGWTQDGRARRIVSWRWLRNTQILHALARYEGDYKIFFGHIGRSLTARTLNNRWQNRFPDVHIRTGRLLMSSRGEEEERRRNWLIDQPDPDLDFNARGSGYVISTPDYRGLELAREVLPRGNAYLFLVGPPPSQRIYIGQAEPAPHDDVADGFEDVVVGIPDNLRL